MILILVLICTVTLVYLFAIKPFNHWANKHVKTGKFTFLFGDNLYLVQGKESFAAWSERLYNKLSNVRYTGVYQFQRPMLLLTSPELIKQMLVKDFDHFLNHSTVIPDDVDELWSNNLMALKGQHWKNMRATLSPSFTSSKMKAIFVLICQNAENFVQHFLKMNEEIIETEFKEKYARYTNDVIASTAFGVQVDSLKDTENEFYLMGKKAATFTFWRKMLLFSYLVAPRIATFLHLPIFDSKMKYFFINLVKDSIQLREKQNIKRLDMLGLLMEARNGHQKEHVHHEIKDDSFAIVEEHLEAKNVNKYLTDIEIAAQSFIFFLAGFETASTTMCFMSYELALNPEVQKKLIEEIDENRPENGLPSYETIVNMTYMDMVLSETLRKWPNVVAIDRVVTKPYTIKPELPDERPVHLDIDETLLIPIFGIHRDPKYYENPEKFDPERFSHENRKSINPYTYMPFGVGPRNCIGSRFALLEVKAVLFYLLCHFEIVPIEKTQIPLKLDKSAFNLTSEKGFHLGLKRRNKL